MGTIVSDAILPFCSYKNKFLTPKLKAYHHFLAESFHPLQGDKQARFTRDKQSYARRSNFQ